MAAVGGSPELDLLSTAAAGMQTQRSILDLAARNVAAAQAATPGHPYARLVAVMRDAADAESGDGGDPDSLGDGPSDDDAPAAPLGVRSEPGTGDALSEMIAVLDAQRAFEQHASIFDIGKRLAERTIDIGRS